MSANRRPREFLPRERGAHRQWVVAARRWRRRCRQPPVPAAALGRSSAVGGRLGGDP
jgi:hypothetical protein